MNYVILSSWIVAVWGTLRVRPSQSPSGETNQRIVYFDGTKVQINEELRTI